jgi:primary-amine oxidase
MKAERTFVENEDDAKMNWSPNGASIIAVVNKDQKNKYGEYPGWRIAPAATVAYSTIQDSPIAGNALNHATHHLYVTKQKDNEVYASGAYNLLDVVNPPVDFAKYFDGESLVQEDM